MCGGNHTKGIRREDDRKYLSQSYICQTGAILKVFEGDRKREVHLIVLMEKLVANIVQTIACL